MQIQKRMSSSLNCQTRTIYNSKITAITSTKGYRSALFKYAPSLDCIYYEAQIVSNKGYARVGIATEAAEINGPIGMDEYGYSFGSKNGYLFHKGKRTQFGERYGEGDIISCLFSDKQELVFFINGQKINQTIASVRKDVYWPAVSSYGNCTVEVNFGDLCSYKEKIFREFKISK